MYSLIWFLRAQVSTLSPPVLEVMDVDFKYPTGPTILRDVNFGLDQSSRVCIVGPNGAGARTAAAASLSLLLFCVSSSRLVSSPLGVRSVGGDAPRVAHCRWLRSRVVLVLVSVVVVVVVFSSVAPLRTDHALIGESVFAVWHNCGARLLARPAVVIMC